MTGRCEGLGFVGDLILKELPGRRWELHETVIFVGRRQRFVIYAGYVTDLASTPRVLHWLLPPNGTYSKAALLHDLLWQMSILGHNDALFENRVGVTVGVVSDRMYPADDYLLDPVDVDGVFRLAMRASGTSWPIYWVMWATVRWAAIAAGRRGAMRLKHWVQLIVSTSAVFVFGYAVLTAMVELVKLF